MLAFLSPEWFEAAAGGGATGAPAAGPGAVVIEQVVSGTPYGEVRYRVVIEDGTGRIIGPGARSEQAQPRVTVNTDWATARGLASGELSAQRALMDGRLTVSGDLSVLTGALLVGVDPLPTAVRQRTSFA